ncbi:MYND finger, partial [Rhizoctonia solani]
MTLRCRSVWYCSTECQSAAWPTHYTTCIPLEEALRPSPPIEGSTYVQALFLAPNSPKHFIVPVRVEARANPTGSIRWVPNFDSDMDLGLSPANIINLEGFGGSAHRFPFHIFFRRSFMNDGSELNQSVRTLTQNRAAHPWAGNIVVLKFHGSRREKYRDFEITDIAVIAHFFLHYPNIS